MIVITLEHDDLRRILVGDRGLVSVSRENNICSRGVKYVIISRDMSEYRLRISEVVNWEPINFITL